MANWKKFRKWFKRVFRKGLLAEEAYEATIALIKMVKAELKDPVHIKIHKKILQVENRWAKVFNPKK